MSTATATRQKAPPIATPTQQQSPLLNSPATQDKAVEYVPLGGKESIKLSVRILRHILDPKTKSGIQASDQDILKFMMLCRARALDPFEGDAFLVGYDGQDGAQFSLITSIYAFLKRAELSQNYDGMESGVIVLLPDGRVEEHEGDFLMPDEKLLGGWAVVHRSDRKYPKKTRLEFAKYSTGKSRWQKDPAGQIVKCAECQALRDTFPTTLGGMLSDVEMARETVNASQERERVVPANGRHTLRAATVEGTQDLPAVPPNNQTFDEQPEQPSEPATEAQQDEIQMECQRSGTFGKDLDQHIKAVGGERLNKLNTAQAVALIKRLTALPAGRQPGDEPDES